MAPERRLFGGASPRSGNVVSEREISRQQWRDFFVEDPMEEGLSDIHMASRRAEEAGYQRRSRGLLARQAAVGSLQGKVRATVAQRRGSLQLGALSRVYQALAQVYHVS
ncbi:uncharacterized protein LOC112346449 isoform X2 [Selaginella moellendorffii]|nr:uncharacterized protein LOC112346449 isoform X2 [Selaginella moellendorffii]|eukprot:XP_024531250.1 uncharacterized protein LOC112346449 isoform X2 [Selaginella moellendorffii]